jgi:hypothetical protein
MEDGPSGQRSQLEVEEWVELWGRGYSIRGGDSQGSSFQLLAFLLQQFLSCSCSVAFNLA